MFHRLSVKSFIVIFVLFLLTTLPTIHIIIDHTNQVSLQLAKRTVETKTLYNAQKVIAQLNREIALITKLSNSQIILDWIYNEENGTYRSNAMRELESYRKLFKDQSYFIGIRSSNNYYFNDKNGTYTGRERRYRLDENDPENGWFFATLHSHKKFELNVDYDENLHLTKVWINFIMYSGKEPVAVVGTGLDLTTFIKEILTDSDAQLMSFFIEKNGYIQAHKNTALIDFRSITRRADEHNSIYDLITSTKQQKQLAKNLKYLLNHPQDVRTMDIDIKGSKKIMALSYISDIGWYNVSIINYEPIGLNYIYNSEFIYILISFILFGLGVMFFIQKYILKPIHMINSSIIKVEKGDYDINIEVKNSDELGRLAANFQGMAKQIGYYTNELENEVEKRTIELQRISVTDPLSGLYNRKGIYDCWKSESCLALRRAQGLSILLIDIDHFKIINDTYGHNMGDKVITLVADTIKEYIHPDDIVGRWGGEEYIVILNSPDPKELKRIAQKICRAVENTKIEDTSGIVRFTVSIGGYVGQKDEELEQLLKKVDIPLYRAKNSGRNKVILYNE
jgi:diguanylate cyclase (GGDEF)-like protein